MRELGRLRSSAALEYSEWEADRVQGCYCDEGWTGYDCSTRICPAAEDPLPVAPVDSQTVHLSVTAAPVFEVKEIAVEGTGANYAIVPFAPGLNEEAAAHVQEFTLGVTDGHLKGFFTMALDSDPARNGGSCSLWEVQEFFRTKPIAISPREGPTIVAYRIQTALEALPSIGTGQVEVTGTWNPVGWEEYTYTFTISFIGPMVGGRVALLTYDLSDLVAYKDAVIASNMQHVQYGLEWAGSYTVEYDDSSVYPRAADYVQGGTCNDPLDPDDPASSYLTIVGSNTFTFQFTNPTYVLAARYTELLFGCPLNTLSVRADHVRAFRKGIDIPLVFQGDTSLCQEPPSYNAIKVERLDIRVPSYKVRVTFQRGYRLWGLHPNFVVDTTGTSISAHATQPYTPGSVVPVAGSPVVANFLVGDWTLDIPLRRPVANPVQYTTIGPFPWCVHPDVVQSAIETADLTLEAEIGPVRVSRSRTLLSPIARPDGPWNGAYEWTLEFLGWNPRDGEFPIFGHAFAINVQYYPDAYVPRTIPPVLVSPTSLIDFSGVESPVTMVILRPADDHAHGESEVQLLECTCDGPCPNDPEDQFVLAFEGQQTELLPFTATLIQVRAALEGLSLIPAILLDATGDANAPSLTICQDGATVSTAITFTHNPGPLPPLRVTVSPVAAESAGYVAPPAAHPSVPDFFGIRTAPAISLVGAYEARKGTRVAVPCANQGKCNGVTGLCECETDAAGALFGPTDGSARYRRPTVPDWGLPIVWPTVHGNKQQMTCGSPLRTEFTCPKGCSGHGMCIGAPYARCVCNNGYEGLDCSERTCPMHYAWADIPLRSEYYPWEDWASGMFDPAAGLRALPGTPKKSPPPTSPSDENEYLHPAFAPYKGHSGSSLGKEMGGYGASYLAHRPVECSNRGTCNRQTGVCACMGSWNGLACQLSPCPGEDASKRPSQSRAEDTSFCTSGAPCVTLRQLSEQWAIDAASGAVDVPGLVVEKLANAHVGGSGDGTPPFSWDFLKHSRIDGLPELGLPFFLPQPVIAPPFVYKDSWDADMIRGCVCGAAQGKKHAGPHALHFRVPEGFDCSQSKCPGGLDPVHALYALTVTADGIEGDEYPVLEDGITPLTVPTFRIQCTVAGGRVIFSWRGQPAQPLRSDETYIYDRDAPLSAINKGSRSFERALQSLKGFYPYHVTNEWVDPLLAPSDPLPPEAKFLCDPAGRQHIYVTLPSMQGNPPPLRAVVVPLTLDDTNGAGITGVVDITVESVGNAPYYECNNRGTCDRDTGRCACQKQFGSSDGFGNHGETGDCGRSDVLFGYISPRKSRRRA